MDWVEVRSEFLALNSYVYVNTASQGLLPRRSIDAIRIYADQKLFGSMYWGEWKFAMEETRKQVAKLINASLEEIGFVPSTTWGINIIAYSIPWEEGDNIVITDLEFPANVFPWQAVGKKYNLEIRVVKNRGGRITNEDFIEKVDENTKVIAVSWVEYANGFVNDLDNLSRLAKENDAYLVVDGIQGVGSMNLDVSKIRIDFLVSGFQKWMLGTGSAFLYINKKLLNELYIPFGGWLASKNASNFAFREYDPWNDAKKVELGTPAFVDFMVAKESLELINSIGIKNIESRNLYLKRILIEGLEDIGIDVVTDKSWKSSIVLFKTESSQELYDFLISRGIIISLRAGGIRVSPHFYNNESDINKLLKAIKEFKK